MNIFKKHNVMFNMKDKVGTFIKKIKPRGKPTILIFNQKMLSLRTFLSHLSGRILFITLQTNLLTHSKTTIVYIVSAFET